mgnify:CR=1 FL=1
MNIGYACINVTLSNKKPKVTTNRTMVKNTFKKKGLDYASSLSLQNCNDLISILNWNIHHKIKLTSRQKLDEQYCWFVVPETMIGIPK